MEHFDAIKLAGMLLFSAVKFFFAPGACLAAGYDLFESIAISATGGMLGVSIFYHSGYALLKYMEGLLHGRQAEGSPVKRKIFNRRNRWAVRVKWSLGVGGLVILTPCLFSIPIGSVIAAKFFHHNKLTFPLLLLSTCGWAVLLGLSANALLRLALLHG